MEKQSLSDSEHIQALASEVRALREQQRALVQQLDQLRQDQGRRLRLQAEQLQHLQSVLGAFLQSPAGKLAYGFNRIGTLLSNLREYAAVFFAVVRREGILSALKKTGRYFLPHPPVLLPPASKNLALQAVYETLEAWMQERELRGLAILPSAFEFEPLYNQRTINFARYLSDQGFAVIYVAWQWAPDQSLEKSYQNVYGSIFQVPLYPFRENLHALNRFQGIAAKYFFCTFPPRIFFETMTQLRQLRFSVAYDLMDDWEAFHAHQQAAWYVRDLEEAMVLNADVIFAVSEPLRQKFAHLRKDIQVIGNGYDPAQLGPPNLALRAPAEDGHIHIGYFGHLTEAWFDWELLFQLLAAREDIFLHLIGYGAPETQLKRLHRWERARYHGKVEPNALHEQVVHWHLGIIPFRPSKLAEAVDPIKVYEYLHFGLPTLVTGIPHIGRYPSVHYCRDLEELCREIDRYDPKDPPESEAIARFLEKSTWARKFQQMIDCLAAEHNFLGALITEKES